MTHGNPEPATTSIVSDVETLTQVRPGAIRERLRPLSGLTLGVDPKTRYRTLAIGVKHGIPSSHNVREWTFPSVAEDIRCHYSEQWLPLDRAEGMWEFERVHFHLLREPAYDQGRGEIVLFHWQPHAGDETDDIEYPRRPHLHVNAEDVPLRKAHLAVDLAPTAREVSSIEYLDDLLDEVAKMLKEEVVERLGNTAPR